MTAATSRDHVSSTFVDNMSLPVHRWFKYSAGFSSAWVESVIGEHAQREKITRVLDPFAGSGTVLLAAQSVGHEAVGVEVQPFVARVARAKLAWNEDPARFGTAATELLSRARQHATDTRTYPDLIRRCYSDPALRDLDALRSELEAIDAPTRIVDLVWLALAAILRPTSHAGTAQWQYILPAKSKKRVLKPFLAFEAQVSAMSADMRAMQTSAIGARAILHEVTVTNDLPLLDNWATLVVTSPPYANNFDYADATRLEMTFFGDAVGWGDLKGIRRQLVRSCTQASTGHSGKVRELLSDPSLDPIRSEIEGVCSELKSVRETKGGRKPYHGMIAGYFVDMATAFQKLRPKCAPGVTMCFVVGDSAPYGVYVPVERWLGELAQAAGFGEFEFEKTRDRNTKWKNRKHTVPLHEGRLWIRG